MVDRLPLTPTHRSRTRCRSAVGRALVVMLALVAAGCGRLAPHYEPASLTVLSTPAGAAITLDGAQTGQVTPFTFTGLAPAAHEIRVSLPEWFADPEAIAVDLGPLEEAEITFAMYQTGLRVTSEPTGARILVDGVDTGRVTPAIVAGLEPGPVAVSLEMATWFCVPATVTVDVVEGQIVEVPAAALRLRSRRTVMLESFGNANCPTCPQAADNLMQVIARDGYGPGRALFLEFSVSWPSPVDPFYLANPTENADRYMYYYVTGAPAIYVNGRLQGNPLIADSTAVDIAGRWATDPGFVVDVDAELDAGASVDVRVTLTPLVGVDLTGCVLYVALYDDLVTFEIAPGNNGQTAFHHMFRDRVDVPPALGALTAGQPAVFDVTLARGTAQPDNATVVAYVQRLTDKVVLQAGSIHEPVPVAPPTAGRRQ